METMIEVIARAKVDDPYERRMTLDEAREYTFLDPDFDPEGSWFAYFDGEAVGFGSCLVESNRVEAGMNEGYVDVDVVPEHRGEDIEQTLLDNALTYLRNRKVESALARCVVGNDHLERLLTANSFEEAFRVYILKRTGIEKVREVPIPEDIRLERKVLYDFTDGELEKFVGIFNDAFQDHLNFAPERKERFVNFRDCRDEPRILTLAIRDEDVVGFCLSEESEKFNRERGVSTGWIDIIGVRPPHRRKGIGRALLADGTNWILERGMDTVYLGVFAKNEKALDLYRSFDFVKERESMWFRKALPQDEKRL